jgi:hypothetical protein
MIFKTEEEFGKVIVELLRRFGFETWQEVHYHRGSIDIVGKLDNQYYIFELKLSLNDQVLCQARRRSQDFKNCHIVVVVPDQVNPDKYHKCKKFIISPVKEFYILENKLQVWQYDSTYVSDLLHPSLQFKVNTYYKGLHLDIIKPGCYGHSIFETFGSVSLSTGRWDIEKCLHSDQIDCNAGMQAGFVITPWKRSCKVILDYLEKNGKVPKKKMYEELKSQLHWASYGSFNGSLRSYSNLEPIIRIKELLGESNVEAKVDN